MLHTSALGKGVDQGQVEGSYFGSEPHLVVVDNLLEGDQPC